jgi:hypothetical protein
MNITTKSMRYFAADCLHWAAQFGDASQRQSIVSAAREWARTADALDRLVDGRRGEALPDLRKKLN